MAPEGGGDAQRALPVVRTPGAIGRGPHLRLQPAVGVDRGTGEGNERRQVVEDPGHELARQRRKVVLAAGIVETVHALVLAPSREVKVAAVAGLVAPGL